MGGGPTSKVRGAGAGHAGLKSRKSRLDVLLVDRGLAESRTRAQALLLAGKVFSGNQRLDKPGRLVAADIPLEVRGASHPWASQPQAWSPNCP